MLYLTPLDIPAAAPGIPLTPEQLGLAVNSVESLLTSQSSTHPALNMIVYVPPIENSPMLISQSESDSFLIPRWGGVNVYNYQSNTEQNVKFPLKIDINMRKVFGVWLGQLRSLLGVEDVK